MIKLAKIVQIDSNRVSLKLEKKVQCFDCKSRCSDGFLNFLFSKKNQGILSVALNSKELSASHLMDDQNFFKEGHKINDIIGLSFKQDDIFKLALILYGVPIILFILMLFLGYYLFQQFNLSADFGGIFGLIMGLFFSKYMIHSLQIKLKPKVKYFK